MRILVVGAGAVGGYFGGRLLEAGRDVTFLVRPARAKALARTGLVIKSGLGDYHHPAPPTLLADSLRDPFDLVLLSCKAYDLDAAIAAFAPAVGPDTAILPLLNGMRHLDLLEQRFGGGNVLGGQCVISSTLDPEGRILHLNDRHLLSFGERDGGHSPRLAAITESFAKAGFNSHPSEEILQEMWEKWVFIATAVGICCLMRGSVGEIVQAGGAGFASTLLDECAGVSTRAGFAPRESLLNDIRAAFTVRDSAMAPSMLRDVERGGPTETEHIIGDLYSRAEPAAATLLALALVHLRTYEIRRKAQAA